MKSILVPIEECPGLRAQLATALGVARRFSGHIDGVAPRSIFGPYVFGDGMSAAATSALESFEQEEQVRAQRAQTAFRDFMREQEVAWGDPMKPSDQATAEWLAEIASGGEAIGQLARLYDLTVLARPVANEPVPRLALLETVLFECGRPILVVPPEMPRWPKGTPDEAPGATGHLGDVILIPWNGSTESARAITFAQPFLAGAKRVVVQAMVGGSVAGPTAGEVVVSLLRANIPAEESTVRSGARSIGEAILEEADRVGADLLVKGAYTHSRLRQMIFGGATSHLLTEAKVPVLLAH